MILSRCGNNCQVSLWKSSREKLMRSQVSLRKISVESSREKLTTSQVSLRKISDESSREKLAKSTKRIFLNLRIIGNKTDITACSSEVIWQTVPEQFIYLNKLFNILLFLCTCTQVYIVCSKTRHNVLYLLTYPDILNEDLCTQYTYFCCVYFH